jgi:hypothetical protein
MDEADDFIFKPTAPPKKKEVADSEERRDGFFGAPKEVGRWRERATNGVEHRNDILEMRITLTHNVVSLTRKEGRMSTQLASSLFIARERGREREGLVLCVVVHWHDSKDQRWHDSKIAR